MSAIAQKVVLHWELHYPAAIGAAFALIGFFFGPEALSNLYVRQWAVENIFAAVFTLSTVTAGFGLAIYTFLLTTESGFIGRVKNSIYYKSLLSYVIGTTALSGILALVSIPGTIIKDAPEPYSLYAAYIGVWLGLSVWTLLGFVRAGHLFSVFARAHH